MACAKTGDKVKVHYTGKLEDGSVFDSSAGREPLEFTIGEKRLISGFEDGIVGMDTGQSKTINIPPEEGYGDYDKEAVITVERSKFPPDIEPQAGQMLNMTRADGSSIAVTVLEVSEANVVLDANHPLAGKDLTFNVELVEIV